jgi:Fic family protein
VDFLHWIASPPAQLDGLLRAGLAQLWFLTLHPYEDGNGRLARAITDRLLAQDCKAQPQQTSGGTGCHGLAELVSGAAHGSGGHPWRRDRCGLLDAEPEGLISGITLRKAISLTKVSRATAWRDLADLVEYQAIEPIGKGRSRAYRIRWP